jgi:hypothetical protein
MCRMEAAVALSSKNVASATPRCSRWSKSKQREPFGTSPVSDAKNATSSCRKSPNTPMKFVAQFTVTTKNASEALFYILYTPILYVFINTPALYLCSNSNSFKSNRPDAQYC